MIVSIINFRSARVAYLLPSIVVTHPRNKPYHTRSTPRFILLPACISPFLFLRSGLNIRRILLLQTSTHSSRTWILGWCAVGMSLGVPLSGRSIIFFFSFSFSEGGKGPCFCVPRPPFQRREFWTMIHSTPSNCSSFYSILFQDLLRVCLGRNRLDAYSPKKRLQKLFRPIWWVWCDPIFTCAFFFFEGFGGESLFSRACNFLLDGKLTFSLLTAGGGGWLRCFWDWLNLRISPPARMGADVIRVS